MASPSPAAPTAAQEWRLHGMLVFTGLIGVSVGTIPAATLGLFMEPLQATFGWSRLQISLGLTIFAVVGLPLVPLAGVLVDRFGPRRVALPGLLFSALTLAGFSLLTSSYMQWLLTWTLYTLASTGARMLVWNTAISRVFVRSRGLAIAVLLCGSALATALAPVVTHWMIGSFGWRGAYLGLGFGWAGIALLMAVIFFRERPAERLAANAAAARATTVLPGGISVREAFHSVRFYRITLAIFLQCCMGAAITVHLVPMLAAFGLSRTEAAGMAAILGTGSIAGKLASGWLVDRFTGPVIPLLSFGGPAIGYLMILYGGGSTLMLSLAVFALGYAQGATLQLATYLTTRYAGMRNFGTIFGFVSAFMALSAGVGPPLAGWIFDRTGSYSLLLTGAIPQALICALLMFRLGRYPVFATDPDISEPAPAVAKA